MCRSIRPLRVAEPPTADGDVRAAALQYTRKVSGSRSIPRRDAAAIGRRHRMSNAEAPGHGAAAAPEPGA